MDTLIVRMYKANDGFNTLLDTFAISQCNGIDSNACYIRDTVSMDTISFFIQQGYSNNAQNAELYCQIRKGYDWSIYIPSIGHADSISDITIPQVNGSVEDCCCKVSQDCYNSITSLKVNETVVDSFGYYFGPGFCRVFIPK